MVGTECGFQHRFQYSIFTTITLPRGFFPVHAKLHSYISKSSQCFVAPVCHCRCSKETCINRFFFWGAAEQEIVSQGWNGIGFRNASLSEKYWALFWAGIWHCKVCRARVLCLFAYYVQGALALFLEGSALACFWCYGY